MSGNESYLDFKNPLIPYSGVATADGNAGGTTIIDLGAGGKGDDFYNNVYSIVINSGTYQGFKSKIADYTSLTGAFTLTMGTGGVITAGTKFAITIVETSGAGGIGDATAANQTLIINALAAAGLGAADPIHSLNQGTSYVGVVTSAAPSATVVVSTDLIGFGDDYFNTKWLMTIVRNDNSHGAVPEGSVRAITDYTSLTGSFVTSAFSANVEAGDIVLVAKLDPTGVGVLASGVFTTSSATVPADTGRGEGTNYWRGCIIMPITGVCAFQPRLIRAFTATTGVFTLADNAPFTAAPGLVNYVILANTEPLVADTDSAFNQFPYHVMGSKADAAVTTGSATASTIAYLKGILAAVQNGTGTNVPTNQSLYDQIIKHRQSFFGIADSGSTTNFTCLKLAGFTDDFFNGKFMMTVLLNANSVSNAPEKEQRLITDYVSTTGSFTVTAFSAAIEANDAIYITPVYDANVFEGPFTSSAATVNTITCAALAAVASQYVGQQLLILNREMRGEARMITAYDSSGKVLTFEPDLATDPDLNGNVDFLVMPVSDYWLYTTGKGISSIFDIVDAIADLSMISDTVTTDGTEQTLWETASPAGVFECKSLKLDTTAMVAGDQIRIRTYYKIKSGGNYIKESDVYITDGTDPDLHTFDLLTNRFGVKATITRTLGTDRAYDYEVAYYG